MIKAVNSFSRRANLCTHLCSGENKPSSKGIGIYTSSITPSPEHPQGIKEKAGMRGM
jgi:hypothetical protein